MEYFFVEKCLRTELSSKRTCMTCCLWKARPESEAQSMIQEFFDGKERTGPSTLMEQWDTVLQRRVQSLQVKVLHSQDWLIGRDSLPLGSVTAGGMTTKLIERNITISTEKAQT